MVTSLPNGGALADARVRVVWPPAPDSDRVAVPDEAFQELAHVPLAGYAPDIQPCLGMLLVEREDFGTYCEQKGFALPKFWFPDSTVRSTAAAVTRCTRWLRALARQGAKPNPKRAMRKIAIARFSGLSARGFDRAWAAAVPREWRRGGAPPRARS